MFSPPVMMTCLNLSTIEAAAPVIEVTEVSVTESETPEIPGSTINRKEGVSKGNKGCQLQSQAETFLFEPGGHLRNGLPLAVLRNVSILSGNRLS
jgi:hypothetical protein